MSLFGMMLDAPLMAASQRWPTVIHAVDVDGLAVAASPSFKRTTVDAVCGRPQVKLLIAEDGTVALWPPRIKGLAPRVRCRDCWELTGRKRPRTSRVSA